MAQWRRKEGDGGRAAGRVVERHEVGASPEDTTRCAASYDFAQTGQVGDDIEHSLGAAGVQEAIYCLLMLQDDFIAPSINVETLDPALDASEIAMTRVDNAGLDTIMTNSFGFGGTNSHALLASHTESAAALMQPAVQYQHSTFIWWDTSSTTVAAMPLLGVSTAALEAGSVWHSQKTVTAGIVAMEYKFGRSRSNLSPNRRNHAFGDLQGRMLEAR